MNKKTYYAQYGEDKALSQIFNRSNGVCIEVGGYDGITGSNTLFFEREGWQCLIIEPMPEFAEKIKLLRSCEVVELAASDQEGEVDFYIAKGVETLSTMELNASHFARISSLSKEAPRKITVKTARLDDILSSRGIFHPDFITIDVEGHELNVLKGLSFDLIHPRIVIIEDNSYGIDPSINQYMNKKGFIRFKKTGCNFWYAKKSDKVVKLLGVLQTETALFYFKIKQKIKAVIR
ncbi:FkbM family methyltransferase [Polynucleobacter paneuropaeus]|nr:FkbM family methyltransferase [Polynucleobacter paneuropaeus]